MRTEGKEELGKECIHEGRVGGEEGRRNKEAMYEGGRRGIRKEDEE